MLSKNSPRKKCSGEQRKKKHQDLVQLRDGDQMVKNLLDDERMAATIKRIPARCFTVLDFIQVFEALYPDEWRRLVERFGQFGEKRRYTVNTYLSNRLDVYSQKPHALLHPFTRYSQARFKDYRKATEEERKRFGSSQIAVFRRKLR
jgi:hypothetical protein